MGNLHEKRKNKERAAICNRMQKSGIDIRGISDQTGVKLSQVADAMLKIQDAAIEVWMEGKAKFTGNNRRFSNGAIAFEIRCAGCGLCFWETTFPFAKCLDCRGHTGKTPDERTEEYHKKLKGKKHES